MASNQEKIIGRYGDGSREEGRSNRQREEYNMEFMYTKKLLDRYIPLDAKVLETGCGTGYYGLYLYGRCENYTGVDITPGNINVFQEKIKNLQLENIQALVGDATYLAGFEDESFDVVLAFGPMYHLPPKEQELVLAESYRVLKPGGIAMFAYITKIGVYLDQCIHQNAVYPNLEKNNAVLTQGIDNTRDDIYWFLMPEEIAEKACSHGFIIAENLGVDFTFMPDMFSLVGERKTAWLELTDKMSQSPSCTGFANHAVLVCRKE